jgi:hypothetical protein
MKRNYIYITISLIVVIAFSQFVSAEGHSDITGDVAHWKYTGTTWNWDLNYEGKSNIDIIELTYTIEGEQVTLTMEVAGTITNSELVSYWAYLNTSDSSYWLMWNDGQGQGMAINTEEGSFEMDFEPEITTSGDTLSATFDVIGTFTSGVESYGWAAEYTTIDDTNTNEWWGDWVPNTDSPFYDDLIDIPSGDDDDDNDNQSGDNGDGSTNGNQSSNNTSGTPGFELLTLLLALMGLIILVMKRRQN